MKYVANLMEKLSFFYLKYVAAELVKTILQKLTQIAFAQ